MKSATKLVFLAKWVLARYLLISTAALTLSGCKIGDQPSAALPPVAEGAALVDAPTADSLPPAPAMPVSEVADAADTYAFPDRAYEMSNMFGDAPPDYVYEYGNVQPWVWVSDDGSECVVEPVPGGERYYYYEAGADEPFFVADPGYGYGFESGRLVAVYDHSGHALPMGDLDARAPIAGRYLMRARSLYDASRQDRHQPVAESNWTARRGMIAGQRQAWQQQMTQDPNWRSFHAQNAPAVEAHWQGERVQRLNWAAHVDETMHNQADAVRERQQAQTVAANRPAPSTAGNRFAAAPLPAVMDHGAVPLQARQAPTEPQQTQAQARPQIAPRENITGRQAPAVQPQASSPQQNMAMVPRHEPPPRPQREAPAPQPQAAPPPQRHAAIAPRQEPSPQQQRPERQAPPTPQPQAAPPPPQHVAMAPRHEPAPPQQRPEHQAPQTPQPQAAPAQPHAAPPPHQQTAAAASNPHPQPEKDDKHKH